MAEGLKIVNELFERAKKQQRVPPDAYLGVNVAVVVLSDPRNADLWRRLKYYVDEVPQLEASARADVEHMRQLGEVPDA